MKSRIGIPTRRANQRGTALIFFTLIFPVILVATSLVLDVGWSSYVKKRAQSAADAAAMAAITDARQRIGTYGSPTCGTLGCQSEGVCPSSGTLSVGCKYAEANAYSGGSSIARNITIAGGVSGNPPAAPDIQADYWVQASVGHSLSQWFSGMVVGNGLRPKATSVGVLRYAPANASLYLLNRKTDCFASALGLGVVCGEDLLALGFNDVVAQGGIYMASSNATGLGLPAIAAATAVGTLEVAAPFTRLMGNGGVQGLAFTTWDSPPQNGFPDGDSFSDPMIGLGQPPAPTGLPNHPVLGGVIVGSLNPASPTLLPPGQYYATLPLVGPTGIPVTITGHVKFGDAQNPPCGGFCNYIFHGGVVTGALSTVTFSPGRYVFAGAKSVGGLPGVGLTIGANAAFKDLTPVVNGEITQNTDAGEIFIFTDSHYPGLTLPAGIGALGLPQARAGITAGVNPTVVLHGLNATSSALPSALRPFAPTLIWQDQANTTVKYTPSGHLDTSCGGICSNILSVPGSQEMVLQASGGLGGTGTQLYGTIYGPRNSWLTVAGLLPHDHVTGPYQVITGSLQLAVNANLNLKSLPTPPTRLRSWLVR